jgi:hypothetical protein
MSTSMRSLEVRATYGGEFIPGRPNGLQGSCWWPLCEARQRSFLEWMCCSLCLKRSCGSVSFAWQLSVGADTRRRNTNGSNCLGLWDTCLESVADRYACAGFGSASDKPKQLNSRCRPAPDSPPLLHFTRHPSRAQAVGLWRLQPSACADGGPSRMPGERPVFSGHLDAGHRYSDSGASVTEMPANGA